VPATRPSVGRVRGAGPRSYDLRVHSQKIAAVDEGERPVAESIELTAHGNGVTMMPTTITTIIDRATRTTTETTTRAVIIGMTEATEGMIPGTRSDCATPNADMHNYRALATMTIVGGRNHEEPTDPFERTIGFAVLLFLAGLERRCADCAWIG
jgi:hypothetical protein